MSDLDQIIARLCLALHPERLRALAAAIACHGDVDAGKALTYDSAGIPSDQLMDLGSVLKSTPIGARDLAGRLQTGAAVAELAGKLGSTELVWTGPSSGLIPVRHTEQVLTGLIDGAQKRLFLVSFVAYNVTSVITALVKAAARGVQINVLLERSEAEGGNVTMDSLGLIRAKIPGAAFYEWNQDVSGSQFAGASVHAKCAVADGREAFVTSANLTGAAMARNMEAGVIISGGPLPAQLEAHLLALITTKHLRRV